MATQEDDIITINSDTDEGEHRNVVKGKKTPSTRQSPPSSALQGKRPAETLSKRSGSTIEFKDGPQKKARGDVTTVKYVDSPFHFTTVQRLPASHNRDCVSLKSLLGNDQLEYMVQLNYMIDIRFVMEHIPSSIRYRLRATFYHGLRHTHHEEEIFKTEMEKSYPMIEVHRPFVPVFGTHHTKAMLLFYKDGTMQLVIHTANMIERDWRNKTQGVFTTGILHKKSGNQVHNTCRFERDIQDYLARYENPEIVRRISQFDFTKVNGVLIASVPGSFSGFDRNKWGHMRLRSVLRQQIELTKDAKERSQIIIQISSVGSLGADAADWLRGEFEASLNACRNQSFGDRNYAELAIVYPTAEDVRTSLEGWEMGGSIPFQSKAYEKQAHYMKPLLHKWRAEKSGRERAMPHIKTFARVTSKDDGDYLSWVLLTSANLSKPAWGSLTKKGNLDIKSYELGVLFYSSLFEMPHDNSWEEDSETFMMNSTVDCPQPIPNVMTATHSHNNDKGNYNIATTMVVPIRLPYDLPLTPYDHKKDHVWLSDKYFPGVDDYGVTLMR